MRIVAAIFFFACVPAWFHWTQVVCEDFPTVRFVGSNGKWKIAPAQWATKAAS